MIRSIIIILFFFLGNYGLAQNSPKLSLEMEVNNDTILNEADQDISKFKITSDIPTTENIELILGIRSFSNSITDSDFDLQSTVTIASGSTESNLIEVFASDDLFYEDIEVFYIAISSIITGSAEIEEDSIGFSIIDNEPPKVTLSSDNSSIDENGGQTSVTLELSRVYDQDVVVALDYTGANSTATDDDFVSDVPDGIITFSPNETQKTLIINANQDNLEEGEEKIIIEIIENSSSNISYSVSDKTLEIIINDDDNSPEANPDIFTNCIDEGNVDVPNVDKTLTITDPNLGLLANDVDPENPSDFSTLTAELASPFVPQGTLTCPTTGLAGICDDGTFEYRHDGTENPSGKITFSYKVTDIDGFSSTSFAEICINPINDCPTIDFPAFSVDEGATFTYDLYNQPGVSDPEKSSGADPTLIFEIVTDPLLGDVSIDANNILTYNAPNNLSGSGDKDTFFKLKVTDGGGCEQESDIQVKISNQQPEGVSDNYTVQSEGILTVNSPGVLDNDPLPDGATSESYIASTPLHSKSFTLNDDGSFIYEHKPGNTAKLDSFSYTLFIQYSDGGSDYDPQVKVYININDCPSTSPDTYDVMEGGVLSIGSGSGILSNDTDIDNDPISVVNSTGVNTSGSSVSVSNNGAFTYTHGGGNDTYDYFTYQAYDGFCNSEIDTVHINIIPQNDCPIPTSRQYNGLNPSDGQSIKDFIESQIDVNGNPISIDQVFTDSNNDTISVVGTNGEIWVANFEEGGILEITDSILGGLVGDTDPEGDDLFIKLDNNYSSPSYALSFTLNSDGTFTYQHDGSNNIYDTIYVEVCDIPSIGTTPCCQPDTIFISLSPVNDCPVGNIDYFSVDQGKTLLVNKSNSGYNEYMYNRTGGQFEYTGVLINDYDDEGDSIWAKIYELPTHGYLGGINPDGSFAYIHDDSETSSDVFSYILGDDKFCDTIDVYININPVNECPVPEDDTYTVDEGGTLTITLPSNSGTLDFNDFPGIMGNDSDSDIGTQQIFSDNLIAYYPMNEFYDSVPSNQNTGSISGVNISQRANELSSNYFYGILKGGVLDNSTLPLISYTKSPQYGNDRFARVNESQAMIFDGSDSYIDVDHQILDLSRSRYSVSSWFNFQSNSNQIQSILNFTINGQEKGLFIGLDNNNIAIGIGNGSSYNVKDLATISNTSIEENEWYNLILIKNENSYKVYLNAVEIFSSDLDNSGLSNISSKLLIGKSLNGNYFSGSIDDILILGDTLSQDEIKKLFYGVSTSLESSPDDGIITSFTADGTFTYVHSGKGEDLEDNFIYKLSDGICDEYGKVTIVINQVNDCPVGVDDYYSVDEGDTLIIDSPGLLSNDTDEENDDLTSSYLDGPYHGEIEINSDGSFKYIHDDTESLLDSIRYLVNDSDINCSDTATVYITINPIPDCPIPSDDTFSILEGGTLVVDTCISIYKESSYGFTNWAENEPNQKGDENFAEILGDGTWNDNASSWEIPHMLEVNQIESSISGYVKLGDYNGHSYFKSTLISDWNTAKAFTDLIDGYLVVISDKNENNAILSMISSTERFHIGLYQDPNDEYFIEPLGGWKWVDDTYLYNEGLLKQYCGVIINDDIGGGDTIFISDFNLPVNGDLINNEIKYDGKFTYVHDGSEDGDTIEYKIQSEICESETWGRIFIDVINVNDCPIAVRDTFYVDEGGTVIDTLGVLYNDYDEDTGDQLRAEKDSASNPNHGLVQIKSDGEFIYAHDGSESLIDSVNYKSIDKSGCSTLSTAIIIINPINDLPITIEDTYSVNEGDTLEIAADIGVLSNDIDDSNQLIALGPISPVSNGTLILNSDGSFRYFHDGTDSPNEVCFTYIAFDGVQGPPPGYSEITQVCINIINRVPLNSGETYNVAEGEVLITNNLNGVLSNATDPDPQDILSVILDIVPSDGSFVINDDGSFVFDHNCSDNPNETYFTYFVTDGEDTTSVADTARIVFENICPVGNNDLYGGVDEGGTLNIGPFDGVLANDSDQNSCDILQVKLLDIPTYGDLVFNSDGSFDYSHDDSENFVDEFTYLLNDGECSTWDTVSVSIRITPVPDTPPVAVNDEFDCINEGDFLQILLPENGGVLINDYDEDQGQILSAVPVRYPLFGTLILNPNGTFIYTHNGGESTTDSFTYYVIDETGLTSDTATVSLCIIPVNDCPIPSDDLFNINEGDVIDSSLVFNDFDVEGDKFLISITSLPNIGGFTWTQDGNFTYSAPDNVPAPGPEIVTFEYIITDTEDGFVKCDSIGTVTILINYENDCPIAKDDSIIIDGSTSDSRIINVLENDTDPDSEIDTTSVKIISGPTFGDAISNIDGSITYNYDESPIPFDTITYSVSDYEGCETIGRVYVYIENLLNPKYDLPNYFTPNGDDFNDYLMIKYENIKMIDLSFEVKIMDRYQRLIYEGFVQSSDKIWDGINSFTSEIVKTDFYFYEITPVEYYNTPYVRRRDKLLGTVYLEKER